MKKKILGAVAVIAIAAMAAFNLNINADANELSALTIDNIEALADGEGGGTSTCSNSCGGAKCGTFTDNDGNSWPVYYC